MNSTKRVLWVDEEQGDFFGIEWMLQDLGLTIVSALSVTEAKAHLAEMVPDAIIMDLIVRSGEPSPAPTDVAGRFSVFPIWNQMTPELKERTVFLTIVSSNRILGEFGAE